MSDQDQSNNAAVSANQNTKPKNISLSHKDIETVNLIGSKFVQMYYRLLNGRDYKTLSSFLGQAKMMYKFMMYGQHYKKTVQNNDSDKLIVIKTIKQLLDGTKMIFNVEKFKVTLSGSRRLNILVKGKVKYLESVDGQPVEIVKNFAEYIHLAIETIQAVWVHTSMFMINDNSPQDIKGMKFIKLYYNKLNERDFNSIFKLIKVNGIYNFENNRIVSDKNITLALKSLIESNDMIYENIKFDMIDFGPCRINFLVCGSLRSRSDPNKSKTFAEFIHVGRPKGLNPENSGRKKKKKKKKKSQQIEQIEIASGKQHQEYWIQSSTLIVN